MQPLHWCCPFFSFLFCTDSVHLCVWWPYFYKLVYKRSLNTASRTSGRNVPFLFCFLPVSEQTNSFFSHTSQLKRTAKAAGSVVSRRVSGSGWAGPPARSLTQGANFTTDRFSSDQEYEYIIRIRRNHCLKRSHLIQKSLKSRFVILQWTLQELRKMHPVPFYENQPPCDVTRGSDTTHRARCWFRPPSRPQDFVSFLQMCKVQLSIRELKLFLFFLLLEAVNRGLNMLFPNFF